MELIANNWVLGCVLAIFGYVLYKYFNTKKEGFGPYNTATLTVILVLFVTVMAFFTGKLSGESFTSVLLVAAGFGGGLMAGKS